MDLSLPPGCSSARGAFYPSPWPGSSRRERLLAEAARSDGWTVRGRARLLYSALRDRGQEEQGGGMRYWSAFAWCGALALLAAGCGQRETPLAPVSGRVFYRGQPLPGGTIVFTPDSERGGSGPLACGEIGQDGRYTLHTGTQPGAVPGWHRI